VHRLFWTLLAIVVLFGSAYGAMVVNWSMGPWEATGIEQDGSLTHMRFDPAMAPADFVPLFPGAQVIQSSRLVSKEAPSGVGSLDLSVRGSAEAVREFYRARLEAAGFVVSELLVPNLNPVTAAYLGLDGGLVAKRTATDDILTLQIRTEEGLLIRSRALQLSWRKISEWPAFQPLP
jgi:hypothetical protein